MQDCRLMDLGLIDYEKAWQIQKDIFNTTIDHKLKGIKVQGPLHTLIVCEHPHVYTFGRSADKNNLLLNEAELKDKNISVYDVERGGDITYHGPGQLVVYPVFDIEALKTGVKDFVFKVEECIIKTLETYGIASERIDGRIGIWLGKDSDNERKIAAIGIKCSRYVTMHGLALNVNTDLKYFDYIVPCGIRDKAVTGIQNEVHRQIDFTGVKKVLINNFSATFELKFI